MSIFGSILSKVFGAPAAHAAPTPAQPGAAAPAGHDAPTAHDAAATHNAAATHGAPATVPADIAAKVDVPAVLDDLNEKNPEVLDWRVSIVDLLKVLGLDSSLHARKELASELHYSGDTNDSAAMNIWLHGKVIELLAANGGKLPADLLKK